MGTLTHFPSVCPSLLFVDCCIATGSGSSIELMDVFLHLCPSCIEWLYLIINNLWNGFLIAIKKINYSHERQEYLNKLINFASDMMNQYCSSRFEASALCFSSRLHLVSSSQSSVWNNIISELPQLTNETRKPHSNVNLLPKFRQWISLRGNYLHWGVYRNPWNWL